MPYINFRDKRTDALQIMKDSADPIFDIPEHNILVDCQSPHAELLDLSTGTVWQSHRPISREAYEAMALPASFRKLGLGRGVMDAHYFRRSPGADTDGPVSKRDVDGHLFIHCANPPENGPESVAEEGPLLLRVDKHHTLIFEARREVDVMTLPDGREYVQVIAAAAEGGSLLQQTGAPADGDLKLPRGWVLRTEKVAERTTVDLPNPTEAFFFANGASFQGPVDHTFYQPDRESGARLSPAKDID